MTWRKLPGIRHLRWRAGQVRAFLRRVPDQADRVDEKLRALAGEALEGRPLAVVDVGAREGLLPELQPIETFVSAVGFDPDAAECERFNAAARERGLEQRFLPYAVTGADEQRTFRLTRKPAASSLLEPNHPDAERMDVVDRFELETRAFGPLLAAEGSRPSSSSSTCRAWRPRCSTRSPGPSSGTSSRSTWRCCSQSSTSGSAASPTSTAGSGARDSSSTS